ncbi:hypothetical protein ACNKHW_16795 [Shigella flexneri]
MRAGAPIKRIENQSSSRNSGDENARSAFPYANQLGARRGLVQSNLHAHHPDITEFSRHETGKCRPKIRIKTLSLGVGHPGYHFPSGKRECADGAVFRLITCRRPGKPFAYVAMTQHYDELIL